MTVKLSLLALLASIGLSLSGCVVYDHGGYDHGYGYGQHRDRGDNRDYHYR